MTIRLEGFFLIHSQRKLGTLVKLGFKVVPSIRFVENLIKTKAALNALETNNFFYCNNNLQIAYVNFKAF